MSERNVADFMNEIIEGVGGASGLQEQIDSKLNKTANAVSATKLQTARSVQTNLASGTAVNFDGTANIQPGVTGVLPVAHGGTGVTNLQNLNVGFATTASVAATSNFSTKASQDDQGNNIHDTYLNKNTATGNATTAGLTKLYTGTGTNTDGTMTQAAIKTALDGKLSTTGKAASAATADSATKATQDGSGNVITSTYLTTTDAANTYLGKSGSTVTSTLYFSNNDNLINYHDSNQAFQISSRERLVLMCDGVIQLITYRLANHTVYEFKADGIYLNGTKITN